MHIIDGLKIRDKIMVPMVALIAVHAVASACSRNRPTG
jgi:hypothetical protein